MEEWGSEEWGSEEKRLVSTPFGRNITCGCFADVRRTAMKRDDGFSWELRV